ncbi:MAG: TIGR03960 family B12-binding radical SAM protein [Spirochaetes bacterium]|jgi:radical SAM family uncharacterized protein/radical SAM-linked protein|nr:TIGR03960 family B12-binding radical SAM protein [Spirochaetota bacterium]
MARLDRSLIEALISGVQRPGRYSGGELNSVVRENAEVRIALSYPDAYEVGMSNNGMKILYEIVNGIDWAACERVFAVFGDFEKSLRDSRTPLYTLETLTPLCDLDMLGFNIGHEMLYTNVLQVLDLGGIGLLARDRKDGPIIMAGGEALSNPVPGAPFFDAMLLGDGEDAILEIIESIRLSKQKGLSRAEAVAGLSSIGGVYVPVYDGRGRIAGPGVKIKRRVYRGSSPSDPSRPVIPSIKIAQERAVAEVSRGCANLCRFCHAGFYDLPYRAFDPDAVAGRILEIVANTGYDEVTLSSLSISDYPGLASLLEKLLPPLTEAGVSISLPSLRVDLSALPFIERISGIRRSSLTFAVESASCDIRKRANKKLEEEELLEIVRRSAEKGWRLLKLYFMIGLPGCEDADEADEIISLLKKVARTAGRGCGINVTVSPFVPKPHTPFEGERQMSIEYFRHAVKRIKESVPRSVSIKSHDPDASVLEGVISRGDDRLAEVILKCYEDGCRFDLWQEHFRFRVWEKRLDEVIPEWRSLQAAQPSAAGSPWDFVETGFERIIGRERGMRCIGKKPAVKIKDFSGGAELEYGSARKRFEEKYGVTGKIRIRLTKTGSARFMSHIEFIEVVKRALRMAGAPCSFTRGFNKRERISAGFPLPLGLESESEIVDVDVFAEIDPGLAGRINGKLPRGIEVTALHYSNRESSLMSETGAVEYRIECGNPGFAAAVIRGLESGMDFKKLSKGRERNVPFGEVVSGWRAEAGSVVIVLFTGTAGSVRADSVVEQISGSALSGAASCRIVKTGQYRTREGMMEEID